MFCDQFRATFSRFLMYRTGSFGTAKPKKIDSDKRIFGDNKQIKYLSGIIFITYWGFRVSKIYIIDFVKSDLDWVFPPPPFLYFNLNCFSLLINMDNSTMGE